MEAAVGRIVVFGGAGRAQHLVSAGGTAQQAVLRQKMVEAAAKPWAEPVPDTIADLG